MQLPRPGDRIRLIYMPGDPDPIKPGATGTARKVTGHSFGLRAPWTQIDVEWDNGRKLMLSVPPDEWEWVESGSEQA